MLKASPRMRTPGFPYKVGGKKQLGIVRILSSFSALSKASLTSALKIKKYRGSVLIHCHFIRLLGHENKMTNTVLIV